MNAQELRDRITIQLSGYCCYKVTIKYRGKEYTCHSINSLAYDRIRGYADEVPDRAVRDFYTYKGALKSLYDECKRANGL